MKILTTSLAALALTGAVALSVGSQAADTATDVQLAQAAPTAFSGADAIAARKTLMRNNGAMAAIGGQIAQGNIPPGAYVGAMANALDASAKTIPSLFFKGSEGAAGQTRALPAIWTDWAGFTAQANALSAAATELRAATTKEQVAAAMQKVGAACGGCHEKFQAKAQ